MSLMVRRLMAGMLGLASLSGCHAQRPDVTVTAIPATPVSPVLSSMTETLTPAELSVVAGGQTDSAYRLGPDDTIAVNVYLHPDLSVPESGATSGNVGGVLITGDGSVQLPLVGSLDLGRMTLAEANNAITAAYAPFIQSPKVSVQLVNAQSLSYYLLGEFTQPGVKYPVHPLTLLEALALGGSVDLTNADLYQAYVAQGSIKLPVDLYALLVEGDLSQNIMLRPGDTIVIPSSAEEDVFVFGSVGKPGAVPFQSGALSLLQALSVAGLDLSNFTAARLENVHIIRARGPSAEFIVVNAAAIMNGKAAPFALEPGDILFVPPTEVATWNEVLAQLIPSLQTVSDVLNPFVSIKYLQQK